MNYKYVNKNTHRINKYSDGDFATIFVLPFTCYLSEFKHMEVTMRNANYIIFFSFISLYSDVEEMKIMCLTENWMIEHHHFHHYAAPLIAIEFVAVAVAVMD